MKLFYEPNNAYFGDCMPFYHDDTFYVFHQRDARNPRPFEPFEWSLATTKDFVHYEDKGVAIPKEGDDSPEQYIFAGSLFFLHRKDMMAMTGEIHLFYGRKKANSIL